MGYTTISPSALLTLESSNSLWEAILGTTVS